MLGRKRVGLLVFSLGKGEHDVRLLLSSHLRYYGVGHYFSFVTISC